LDGTHFFDIFESLVPVDMWLSDAEKVEIGAIDDQDEFLPVLHYHDTSRFLRQYQINLRPTLLYSEEVSWRIG